MTDLPPDLARLRVVETYLLVQLRHVREAIRLAEQRERRQRTEGRRALREADAADRLRRRRQSETEALAAVDADDRPGGPGRAPRTAHAGRTTPNAAVKWWHVEPAQSAGPAPRPAYLHRGDCPRYRGDGRPGFTRDEARAALADRRSEVPTILPCPQCRPDFGLA
ncbi:DUF6233 domain-containing protein [Actinacidiphila acidipaludis]|uniref:DUF6233 domain-containing protein n=1 Tax=Actinacidiphila acidipaludis TaxID=2873382 RepID=A0ABS7QGZ2_9ACTN|nr:DUF6233 domain-containing protein [Streptomyces acidipaludis]MBY8882443.1 DUF6233 domain-containing protein [Streptomyces acidipaludis]